MLTELIEALPMIVRFSYAFFVTLVVLDRLMNIEHLLRDIKERLLE